MDFKIGDRVELVSMGPDPDPIMPGTRGTVDWIHAAGHYTTEQIGVKWDSGRSLNILPAHDKIRKI